MKIVLTGATGRIGSSVLRHCLASPNVTSVVVLSRRSLPYESSLPQDQQAKLRTVLLKDKEFLTYPSHVMDEVRGAEACVWALSVPIGKSANATRECEVDYPTNAAKAFKEQLAGDFSGDKVFRFVLISADMVTEESATQELWYKAEFRKAKVTSALKHFVPSVSEFIYRAKL